MISYPRLVTQDPLDPRFVPELNKALREIFERALKTSATITKSITVAGESNLIEDTHVNRGLYDPTGLPIGKEYWETDRTVRYRVEVDTTSGLREWFYAGGTMRSTLAGLPAGLGANDVGFLFHATDYERVWRWTGAAWTRAEGQLPTLCRVLVPVAPGGFGWKLLDGLGNPFTYTLDNATTATVTIQDARGYYAKMAAAFTGNQVAAVAPGLSGNTASGAAVIGTPSATQGVQSGGGVTVAAFDHNHTDSGHTHAVGTLVADALGEPPHMDWLPYVKL